MFQVRKEKLRSDVLKAYLKQSIVFKGLVKELHTHISEDWVLALTLVRELLRTILTKNV